MVNCIYNWVHCNSILSILIVVMMYLSWRDTYLMRIRQKKTKIWDVWNTLYTGTLLSRYPNCHKNLQFNVFFCCFTANDLRISLYVPTKSSCMRQNWFKRWGHQYQLKSYSKGTNLVGEIRELAKLGYLTPSFKIIEFDFQPISRTRYL